jgi:hypothetical protein
MDWQNTFYFFGVFFFITWFIFLTATVVFIIKMMKQMQQMQLEMQTRLQTVQDKLFEKLDQPSTTVLMSLLPLTPTIASMVRKMARKKGYLEAKISGADRGLSGQSV